MGAGAGSRAAAVGGAVLWAVAPGGAHPCTLLPLHRLCAPPPPLSRPSAPTLPTQPTPQVPPLPWWRGPVPQAVAAGLLPFSAIYVELHYVFLSVWGHKA